jgi:hypothetical protein
VNSKEENSIETFVPITFKNSASWHRFFSSKSFYNEYYPNFSFVLFGFLRLSIEKTENTSLLLIICNWLHLESQRT